MSEILGALFAVLIGLMILPAVGKYQQVGNENSRELATAQQQQQLYAAAQAYVQQNATTLMQRQPVGAANPTIVGVAMLQNAGFLPAGFSAVNPYGQTWQVQVRQPETGKLLALAMSTGGFALPDLQANMIASLVGAGGGFIPNNDSTLYAADTVYGSYGGWSISTTGYAVAGGHLAALVSYNTGQIQIVNNYLYLNAVPGQPQLNQMNTALDMGNNNIFNVGTMAVGTSSPGYAVDVNGKVRIDSDSSYAFLMNTPNSREWGELYYNQIKFQSDGRDVWLLGNNPYFRFNLWDSRAGREIFTVNTGEDLNLLPGGGTVQAGYDFTCGTIESTICNTQVMTANSDIKATSVALVPPNFPDDMERTAEVKKLSLEGGDGSDYDFVSLDTRNNRDLGKKGWIGSVYLNDVYLKSVDAWLSSAGNIPAGTLCGYGSSSYVEHTGYDSWGNPFSRWTYEMNWDLPNGTCQGHNPYFSCPSEYSRIETFEYHDVKMWSCAKN